MNGGRLQKMFILSCQGVIKLTAQSEQTMPKRCTKRLSSAKKKNSKVLMSILTNTLFVFSYGLLGFLHHMWSTELQNSNSI